MPPTYLLFLLFMCSAIVSPLVLIGLIWALTRPRWRAHAVMAGIAGMLLACGLCAIYILLNRVMTGDDFSGLVLAGVAGAGWTIGTVAQLLLALAARWFFARRHRRAAHGA